jgi:hypothetical protein
MNRKLNVLLAVSLTLAGVASAQTDSTVTAAQFNALNDSYMKTKAVVDKMSKISAGGYIQAQYQLADSLGAKAPVDGGAFAGATDQRFLVRRARMNVKYNGTDTKLVLEVDVANNTLTTEDAYVQFTEPWMHTISLTVGNQNQPYGFEIQQSSAAMEWVERSRLEQNIFHGEKDLGAVLGINPTKDMGVAQYFNLNGGLFNGTEGGQGGATGTAIDNKLNFIGRLGFKAPMPEMGFEIDGGVSDYTGFTQDANDTVMFTSNDLEKDSVSAVNKGRWFDRDAFGADIQGTYKIPVIGNLQLRGEFSTGKAPTTVSGTTAYGAATSALVERNFEGWYVAWIQNFTDMFQTVVRYDEYDPNTDVSGSSITKAAGFTTSDIKYDDWGLGLNYLYNPNLKFLAWVTIPTNETTGLAGYTDNYKGTVYTLRMQVKI